jgi:Tfp pilus assembly protein PilX
MFKKKGVVLFIVLGTLLVVVSLATVILSLILSHARLTYHQTSRIQAYYASQSGINYALEKLRLGNDANWPATGTYTHYLCRSGCSGSGDLNDPDLPNPIQQVEITVGSPGTGISGTRPISAKAIYTYTP